MANLETTLLDISVIRTDGGTQTRAGLNTDTVAEYADAMTDGAEFPAVVVYYDGAIYWLADGFHRLAAARQIEFLQIDAEIRQGSQRDAVLHSVGANATHGLRRSNGDKRRAVETLLRDPEWSAWSNREIARRTGVNDKTVAAVRSQLSAEFPQIDQPDTVMVSRGGTTYEQNKRSHKFRTGDFVETGDGRHGFIVSLYYNGRAADVKIEGSAFSFETNKLVKVSESGLPFHVGDLVLWDGMVRRVLTIDLESDAVTFDPETGANSLSAAIKTARPLPKNYIEPHKFIPEDQWDDLPDDPPADASSFAVGDIIRITDAARIAVYKIETGIIVSFNAEGAARLHDQSGRLGYCFPAQMEKLPPDEWQAWLDGYSAPEEVTDAPAPRAIAFNDDVITRAGRMGVVININGQLAEVLTTIGAQNHYLHGLKLVEDHALLTGGQRDALKQIAAMMLRGDDTSPAGETIEADIEPLPEPERLEIEALVLPKRGIFGTGYALDHDLADAVQKYLDDYDLRTVRRVRLVLEVVETEAVKS